MHREQTSSSSLFHTLFLFAFRHFLFLHPRKWRKILPPKKEARESQPLYTRLPTHMHTFHSIGRIKVNEERKKINGTSLARKCFISSHLNGRPAKDQFSPFYPFHSLSLLLSPSFVWWFLLLKSYSSIYFRQLHFPSFTSTSLVWAVIKIHGNLLILCLPILFLDSHFPYSTMTTLSE